MRVRPLRRVADLATLVIVAAILVGTLSPPESPTATTFGLNPSLGHLGLFLALGVAAALRFAVSARARRFPRSTLAMTFFAFWLLAAGTEFLQGFVGRDPSFADWLVDMVSAVAGFLGGSAVLRLALPRLGVVRANGSPPAAAARRSRTPRRRRVRRHVRPR